MTQKPTVLFLCQHNAGRSQLGAALLEVLAPDRFTAASAGFAPAETVNPAIASTVAELGLDISGRTPRSVTVEDLEEADIVVAMKPGLPLPVAPTGRFLEWTFPDPADWSAENVRPLREAVATRIRSELLGEA